MQIPTQVAGRAALAAERAVVGALTELRCPLDGPVPLADGPLSVPAARAAARVAVTHALAELGVYLADVDVEHLADQRTEIRAVPAA